MHIDVAGGCLSRPIFHTPSTKTKSSRASGQYSSTCAKAVLSGLRGPLQNVARDADESYHREPWRRDMCVPAIGYVPGTLATLRNETCRIKMGPRPLAQPSETINGNELTRAPALGSARRRSLGPNAHGQARAKPNRHVNTRNPF